MSSFSNENNEFYKKVVKKRPLLLYKLDKANRLLSSNEPEVEVGEKAPLLFVSIGSGEFVYHYRKGVTDAAMNGIDSIVL